MEGERMTWIVLIAAVAVVYRWRGKGWWNSLIWAAFTVFVAWGVVVAIALSIQ
ncbi:MAG: hypothetical protein ACR2J8_01445 [Thermomicrobiales bacterium]